MLALVLAPTTGARADAKSETEASRVVGKVVDEVIAVLSNGELDTEAKRAAVENIAKQNFDFPVITRLVLSRN